MKDKVFEVVDHSKFGRAKVKDGDTEIIVYLTSYDDPLVEGDKITIEVFGEKDGYKQAVVNKVIEKVERPEPYIPKTIKRPKLNSNELMEKYKTKENLIENLKKDYADDQKELREIGLGHALPRQEEIDKYIKNLDNCLTWEELAEVYNNPPISHLR